MLLGSRFFRRLAYRFDSLFYKVYVQAKFESSLVVSKIYRSRFSHRESHLRGTNYNFGEFERPQLHWESPACLKWRIVINPVWYLLCTPNIRCIYSKYLPMRLCFLAVQLLELEEYFELVQKHLDNVEHFKSSVFSTYKRYWWGCTGWRNKRTAASSQAKSAGHHTFNFELVYSNTFISFFTFPFLRG